MNFMLPSRENGAIQSRKALGAVEIADHPEGATHLREVIQWQQSPVWRWLFCGFILLYLTLQPIALLANAKEPAPTLVSQEFHYHLAEAGEVYLVWGFNGWQLPPAELHPPGTVVEFNVTHTPMAFSGNDTFSVKLQVPAGTVLDYGFQTRRKSSGTPIEWLWDGDYRLTSQTDEVTTVQSTKQVAKATEHPLDFTIGPFLLGVLMLSFVGLVGLKAARSATLPTSSPSPGTVILATSGSLYLLLLVIRSNILGYTWLSWQQSWPFLPTILAGGYYDLLFVTAITALSLGLLWLLRRNPSGQRWLIGFYYGLALLSLLSAFINIHLLRVIGRPFTYQWLYYSDFLQSTEANNAIAANLSPALGQNLLSLCGALVVLSRLLLILASLLPRPVQTRWLAGAAAVGLLLYLFLARSHVLTNDKNYAREANSLVAFAESIIALSTQPQLSTMALNPEDFAEFTKAADNAPPGSTAPLSPGKIQNVIVVVLESVAAEYLDAYGGAYPLTPELNRYRGQTIQFDNIYAHAPASNQSLFSLLSATYPLISHSSMTQLLPDVPLPTLSSTLKQHGYRTAFFSAGETSFQQGDEFLAHRQFDRIQDANTLVCSQQKVGLTWVHSDGVDEECLIDAFRGWQAEAAEQPFFAMLWTVGTHYPYFVMGEEVDYGVADQNFNRYLNALRHTDQAIGSLLRTLEERSLLDSTLLVFVGDHGEAFGQHDQYTHASKIYQENIHVPLLLLNPSFAQQQPQPTVGGHIDIAPTILDLLALPAPATWQGQSLFHPQRPARTYFFAPWADVWFGYREGNLKFLYNATTQQNEIYDVVADPRETTNLVEQMPALVPQAQRRLAAWVQQQNQVMQPYTAQLQRAQRQVGLWLALWLGGGLVLLVAAASAAAWLAARIVLPPFRLGRRFIYLRDLLTELVLRDFKLRYKRSVLGVAWSLLNPLAQLLILYFVFSQVLPLNIPNYALFLSIGILVWSWFQSSLLAATGAIVDNPGLVRRPGFPTAILPVVAVTTQLIHFLLALALLLGFVLWGAIPLSLALVTLPLVIVLQFLVILSLAYFFATLHVTLRDTQYLLGVFLLLGFYISPVFYEPTTIPAHYQWLFRFNPMVDVLNAYRQILLQGEFPTLAPLLLTAIVTSGLLLVGYRLFSRARHRFIEEL